MSAMRKENDENVLAILQSVKFAENEAGIISKFKHNY